jgi:hypothetical protein
MWKKLVGRINFFFFLSPFWSLPSLLLRKILWRICCLRWMSVEQLFGIFDKFSLISIQLTEYLFEHKWYSNRIINRSLCHKEATVVIREKSRTIEKKDRGKKKLSFSHHTQSQTPLSRAIRFFSLSLSLPFFYFSIKCSWSTFVHLMSLIFFYIVKINIARKKSKKRGREWTTYIQVAD